VKVLLTGAAGFVGTALWAWLNDHGHDVVAVDLTAPEASSLVAERFLRLRLDRAALIRRDICGAVGDFGRGCDVVVALAGLGGARGTDLHLYHQRNVATLVATLAAVDRSDPCPVLFTSSSSVYGAAPGPHTESTPPEPVHLYGESKLAAERLARGFAVTCPGAAVTALRLFTVYGPGQRPDMMFARVLREREVPLFGGGTHRRSFSFIDDVASAIGRLATQVPVQPGFRAVNVGTPESRTLQEALAILRGLGASTARLLPASSPVAEPLLTQSTDEVLSDLLGERIAWTALEEGLRRQWGYETSVLDHVKAN